MHCEELGARVDSRTLEATLADPALWKCGRGKLLRRLDGGLTNRSFLVADGSDKRVLRINAANSHCLGIDREQEIRLHILASEKNLAPVIRFASVSRGLLVTDFVKGQPVQRQDLHQPEVLLAVADLVRGIQRLKVQDSGYTVSTAEVWIDHYWSSIEAENTAKGGSLLVRSNGCHEDRSHEEKLNSQLSLVKEMMVGIAKVPPEVQTLAHSDLAVENLIMRNTGQLIALDWEYAGWRHPLFDPAGIIEQMLSAPHGSQAQAGQVVEAFLARLGSEKKDMQGFGEGLEPGSRTLTEQRLLVRYLNLLWHRVQQGHWDRQLLQSMYDSLSHTPC
ncbi:MAG: phosphotransferase [bacterium]